MPTIYYNGITRNRIQLERIFFMQTHYFIALSLPTEVKRQLKKHYDHITMHFPFQKPVHELDYHITLAFLGAHDETTLQQVMNDIAATTIALNAFPLTIDGYGTFGNSKAPRIFWNRLQHEQALFDLQQMIADHCRAHGIQLETRPYNPHITVARKWAGENEFNSELLEQQNPFAKNPIQFLADEIVLYRTNLTATPKYENIASITLKKSMDRS